MTLPCAAREPDRLVHGSSDCGVEGRAPRHARRSTALLGGGDHHGADAAGGFPPGATPDRGLIASLLRLLGLDLAAPDHSTISRRGETLPVSRPRPGSEPVHLLVDSTGLKLCGPGECWSRSTPQRCVGAGESSISGWMPTRDRLLPPS